MGNATPKLKQVADDVCGHVSEDGIYHYCVDHGLI
jgi:hydroxymethylpyrimidine pyrophosphatase-like HAD family hydrolase